MTEPRYSIVTPSIVPPEVAGRKKFNLGDGFIARRIEGLLAPARPAFRFSYWRPLSASDIAQINSTAGLVLAGANPLSDDYTLVSGMTRESLRELTVPIVPFGVGVTGEPARNRGLSEDSRHILRAVHERIELSSWRCPRTLRYLVASLPELAERMLMTCCPVLYDAPLLGGTAFGSRADTVACTATERGRFWRRECAALESVASRHPDARRLLVLHQRFDPPSLARRAKTALTGRWQRSQAALIRRAERLGFEVHAPESVEDCWRLYETCDLHIGSRLHAHLYFLSQARRSFLVRVDGRADGFAEALGFELFDPVGGDLPAQDFERCRARALAHYPQAERFVLATRRLLGVA